MVYATIDNVLFSNLLLYLAKTVIKKNSMAKTSKKINAK